MEGFIFGGNSGVATPQELEKKRELVRAVMARNAASQPKNVWEGLNSAAESITGALKERRLDKAEAAGVESANSAYAPVIEALKGGGQVDMSSLTGVMSNEWLNPGQRATVQALMQQQMAADAPLTKWQSAQLAKDDEITPYQKRYLDILDQKAANGAGGQYGLNVIYGTDEFGNTVAFQTNKGGGAPQPLQLPAGVKLAPGVTMNNLGTSIVGTNNKTGQVVNSMPIDVAGKASLDAQGEYEGKAVAAAPGDYQAGQNALDEITKIRTDPYKSRGTGFSSVGNVVPGTGGFDFQNKVNQAKSGAFLTSIQQMRGLGQLSNVEGQTATAAVNRMNTATSEEEFDAALADYEKIIMQGMAKAAKRLPAGLTGSGDPAAASQAGGTRLKFNPATGELE